MNKHQIIGRAILERRGFFSMDQLIRVTKISRKYCKDILDRFCQEGIIKQIKKDGKEHIFGRLPIYAIMYLIVDRKKLVTRIAPRRKKGTIQDRMWYVMRNKFRSGSSFNLRDLILLAGATKGMAQWYLTALHRGGYIAPSRRAGPGIKWRLTKDLGPERPYIIYRQRNTGYAFS